MKSTLKIETTSHGNLLLPVIKIVQPVDVIRQIEDPEFVDDPDGSDNRDTLINSFLRFPMNRDLNEWFQVNTRFPIPFNSSDPTHYITTIAAVDEDDLFFRFKHSILNRIVPYEDQVKINRDQVPVINPELEGNRRAERIDLSVEKHKKITEFFTWLEETPWATWDEQQPTNPDGRPRN